MYPNSYSPKKCSQCLSWRSPLSWRSTLWMIESHWWDMRIEATTMERPCRLTKKITRIGIRRTSRNWIAAPRRLPLSSKLWREEEKDQCQNQEQSSIMTCAFPMEGSRPCNFRIRLLTAISFQRISAHLCLWPLCLSFFWHRWTLEQQESLRGCFTNTTDSKHAKNMKRRKKGKQNITRASKTSQQVNHTSYRNGRQKAGMYGELLKRITN